MSGEKEVAQAKLKRLGPLAAGRSKLKEIAGASTAKPAVEARGKTKEKEESK